MTEREAKDLGLRASSRGAAWRMREASGTRRRARYAYALVLLSLAASCSTWRPIPGAGLARVDGEWLGHAKVVLLDGTELDLEQATIRRDSIVGLGGLTSTRLAVARSDVARLDTRRTDNATTFLVGVLAPVALAFLYTVAVQAGRD